MGGGGPTGGSMLLVCLAGFGTVGKTWFSTGTGRATAGAMAAAAAARMNAKKSLIWTMMMSKEKKFSDQRKRFVMCENVNENQSEKVET